MAARKRAAARSPEAPPAPAPAAAAADAPASSPSPEAETTREPVRAYRIERSAPVRAGGHVLTERGWVIDTEQDG